MDSDWKAINTEWKRLVTACGWHVDVGPRWQERVREPASGWGTGTPGDQQKRAVPSRPDDPKKELLVFTSPVRMELCWDDGKKCGVYRVAGPPLARVVDVTRIDLLDGRL